MHSRTFIAQGDDALESGNSANPIRPRILSSKTLYPSLLEFIEILVAFRLLDQFMTECRFLQCKKRMRATERDRHLLLILIIMVRGHVNRRDVARTNERRSGISSAARVAPGQHKRDRIKIISTEK